MKGDTNMSDRYYGCEYGNIKRADHQPHRINTLDELYDVLLHCWSRETAYPSCQSEWVSNDPTYGQCAITAMLVCDMFGGTIHRIRVNGGGTHYFNKIDGHYLDLTRQQFDLYNIPVEYEPNDLMDRQYCGKNPSTDKRYKLLVANISAWLARKENK